MSDPEESIMVVCETCGPIGVSSGDRWEADARDHCRNEHDTVADLEEA